MHFLNPLLLRYEANRSLRSAARKRRLIMNIIARKEVGIAQRFPRTHTANCYLSKEYVQRPHFRSLIRSVWVFLSKELRWNNLDYSFLHYNNWNVLTVTWKKPKIAVLHLVPELTLRLIRSRCYVYPHIYTRQVS